MQWDAITTVTAIVNCVATVVSMIAYILTLLYIRAELRAVEKDRYLTITNQLFDIWQSQEFMQGQLWLLHRLQEQTWQAFQETHGAEVGEAAFYRVGGFYDRVGTLVRMGLINQQEILATVGTDALAVWQKIRPLVHDARRRDQATLFLDYERLLPACSSCHAPAVGGGVSRRRRLRRYVSTTRHSSAV